MDDSSPHTPDPRQLHAHGDALHRDGRFAEAAELYRRALAHRPDQVQSLNNLALALKSLDRPDEALDCFRQALALRPESAQIAMNLANLLKETGQIDPAIALYHQSLKHRPADADTLTNLGATLRDAGQLDEAIACFRQAIAIHPDHAVAHSGLLYTLHFDPRQTRHTLIEEHRAWNRQHALALTQSAAPHANTPNPTRRLRVGYVSPSFSNHPVGRFMLPLLSHHDRERFEIHCYSDTVRTDAMTERLRSHADHWHVTARLSDEQLAERIRADGIDILIDLTLHMAHNRLLTFARKPAPAQMTYLAYCSTSGLDAMDDRISDRFLDPDPLDAGDYSEQTLRLPHCYWCYTAPDESPAVAPVPSLQTGRITFGCLNNFVKISPPIVDVWIELLHAVPDARLLLHAHDGEHRVRLLQRFAAADIDPFRIEFVGFLSFENYLRQYQAIDIALDPFPYAGGTTTCDALWMGVPVVSMVGSTAVSRSGLSILSAVGLSELVATTPADYVRIAIELTHDPHRLNALRHDLRDRMQDSPLMDAAAFTRDMESIYRTAWTRWCDHQSKT